MGHYDKQREAEAEVSRLREKTYLKEIEKELVGDPGQAVQMCLDHFHGMDTCRNKIFIALMEVADDTMRVFDHGATKHPDSGDTPNFLTPNGNKCSLEVRGKSALGHVAKSYKQPDALDDESGLEHILHAIASLSVIYIRHKRGIVHPDDIKTSPVRDSRITNTNNLCAPSNWQYPGEATRRGDE